jgi:hypothetical protein
MTDPATPIYLHEKPHATVGLEQEYADGIGKLLFPVCYREDSSLALRPAGAFKVDANGAEWPSFVFLWKYAGGWQAWMDERKPVPSDLKATGRSAELTADPGMVKFVNGATKWRKRSIETVLVPLPFSPLPAAGPDKTVPGSVLLEQRFTVQRGHVSDYLAAMENSVLKRAADDGLELQLFSRVGHRPLEFAVFWTMTFDRLAQLQTSRAPENESSFLPGLDAAWEHVVDLTENTLIPLPYSPLGGTS